MSTVLWGGRRGDTQYGSRDYWTTHIPIDPAVAHLRVDSTVNFAVGYQVLAGTNTLLVRGIEYPDTLGVAKL